MNLYNMALFFHIVGALGLFVAIGLEWFGLTYLQRTRTVEQVADWFDSTRRLRGLAGVSMLVILIAGGYMTAAAWGGADWIEVAFGVMLLQGAVAAILTTPRMREIQKAVSREHGPHSAALEALLHHPLLWVSMLTRASMALGIIFMMAVKPAMMGSLAVVGVSIVVGLALAMMTMGSRRTQEATA